MTKFTLTINCDNDAFKSEHGGDASRRYEVGTLLRVAAEEVESGYIEGSIVDTNGNKVGAFRFAGR
jgi:hypothetical protein